MSSTYDNIKNNLAALGLNNPSAAAIENKIAEAVSFSIDNTITEINNSQQSILDIINGQRYGKPGYYVAKAKYFQYGDNLVIDPATLDYIYEVIDTTKQIVSQAAFEDLNAQLFLKVATVNLSGNLIPLSNTQLGAFKSYFSNFEIPGLPVSIISGVGNVLSFYTAITYYSTYDLPTLKTNLANAMNEFKKTFEFNGVFYTGDLEAYIRKNVPGIRDCYISNTLIDGSVFSGSTVLASGYFNYTTTIFDSITYQGV